MKSMDINSKFFFPLCVGSSVLPNNCFIMFKWGWMSEYERVRNREVREMNRKVSSAQATVYIYNHKEANTLRKLWKQFEYC